MFNLCSRKFSIIKTHHKPICPLVFHTALFSILLAKGNQEFQRNLLKPTKNISFRLKKSIRKWKRTTKAILLPNHACWSPCTSIARPKSANLTAAPFALLASNKFSGWKKMIPLKRKMIEFLKHNVFLEYRDKRWKLWNNRK